MYPNIAHTTLATARAVVAEVAPWESATLAKARMTDDLAWVSGALSCVVRRPVAHLPSGRAVFGLGDAVTGYDPVSAQGANSAAKMAHGIARAVAERGTEPLDAAWMESWRPAPGSGNAAGLPRSLRASRQSAAMV